MPHLVEGHDDDAAFDLRLRQLARLVADPTQHRYVGNAEQAAYGAKAHIAHGVEQRRQRLHRRRLAARRRHGEVASATAAVVALMSANDPVLSEVLRATALAADLGHSPGPRRFDREPMDSAISPHGKPQATSHFDAVRPEEARKLSEIRTLVAGSGGIEFLAAERTSSWPSWKLIQSQS
jgi:hypothetical protein